MPFALYLQFLQCSTQTALEKIAQGVPDKLKANVPMKRFAEVEEQVGAMMWLCSEQASFVTGLALPVDGGLTA